MDKALRVAEQPGVLTPEVAVKVLQDIADLSGVAATVAAKVAGEYAGRLRLVEAAEDIELS